MATKKKDETKTIGFDLNLTRAEIAGYLKEQVRSEITKRKAAVQKKRHPDLKGIRGKVLTQEEIEEVPRLRAIFELARSIVTEGNQVTAMGAVGYDASGQVAFKVFSHREGEVYVAPGSHTFWAELNLPPEELNAFWKEQSGLEREYTRLVRLFEKYTWMDMTQVLVAHAIEKSEGSAIRLQVADLVDELVNKGE